MLEGGPMARISNFIYCLNSVTNENEANVLGVLSAITPEYIPGAFSFSVFCSILDLSDGPHTIKMQFKNPDEEVLVNIEGMIPYEKQSDSNLPQEYVGINISSILQNVIFKKSGLYKTVVIVDDIECGTYKIFVKGKNEEE